MRGDVFLNIHRLQAAFSLTGKILTACFVLSYTAIFTVAIKEGALVALKLLCFSGLAFLLISLLRRFLGKARPYQENNVVAPRKGKDDSFPSRHAYAAFFIATLAFWVTPIFSYTLLPFAVLLSLLRVLIGVHYPIDVIFGAFLGVALGILNIIIL